MRGAGRGASKASVKMIDYVGLFASLKWIKLLVKGGDKFKHYVKAKIMLW